MQGVARAKVYQTEDQERVELAIKNVLSNGDCNIVQHEDHLDIESPFSQAKSLE